MAKQSWQRLFSSELSSEGDAGWKLTNPPSSDEDGAFWKGLAHVVDPRYERPQARPDVVVELLDSDQGAILTDDKNGQYTQVASEDLYLWERMDGSRTQIDLVVDYVMKYKALAPTRIAGLVESLRVQGLLTDPPEDLYARLRMNFQQSTPLGRVNKFTQTFLKREFAIGGIDTVVEAVYRGGGRLLYTLPVQVLLWLSAIAGLVAFLWLLTRREFSLLGEGTLVQGATTLAIFQFLSIFLHEWAHALTVKAFGRKVRRAGFFLLYGLPGVFVDTTDIWPAGKRAQMAVTWAGPFCNLVLGGISALWIVLNPSNPGVAVAYQFAVSQYSLVLLNLTPFIRLDGYYLLADWLGIANLNQRSSGFLRNGMPGKFRQAWQEGHLLPRFTREELILVIFGGLSALWIANLLGLAVLTAPVRMVNVLTSALGGGLSGASPVTLGFTLVGMFFTLLLLVRALNWLRQTIRQVARAFQTAPVGRMALLFGAVALIIASIPDVLIWQNISESTALVYAALLSLGASLLCAVFSARLSRDLRGSRLRFAAAGMQLTSLLLLGVDLIASYDLLPVEPLLAAPLLRAAALLSLLPGLAAFLVILSTTGHLAQSPLKWGLLLSMTGGVALLLDVVVSIPGVEIFLAVAGRTLIASALILHYGLLFRPLVMRRVAPPVAESDPALLLAGAVKSVVRELVQTVAEIDGKPAMLKMVAQINVQAASGDLPFWLTMDGSLGDQTTGSIEERAGLYASILNLLRRDITQRLGAAAARDAYSQALIELPLVSRMLIERWLPGSVQGGEGNFVEDDRARLRLAGRRIAETLVISCAQVYGWRLSDEVVGGFNRVAASAGWPLYIRGNGRVADELSGDVFSIAQIYADALQDLLGRIVRVAGIAFVERGLLQVYDTLPWEVREVAHPTLFRRLSWAQHLVAEAQADSRIEFLKTVPLLSALSAEDLSKAAQGLSVRHIRAGRTVLAAGTYLERLAVIRKGQIQAVEQIGKQQRVAERLGSSSLIGWKSLSQNQSLPYRYIAQTPVELWEIDSRGVLAQMTLLRELETASQDVSEVQALLSRIPLFAMLDTSQRAMLAQRLEQLDFPAGSAILQEGQASSGFYVLRRGEVDVLVTGVDGSERHLSRLGAGEFFGETALITGAAVSATIRCLTEVTALRLSPGDFQELIAAHLGASLEQVQSRRAKQRAAVQHLVIAQEGVDA